METKDLKDFYNKLPQHVKDGIEQGLQDIENGNLYDHEEVMEAARIKYSLISK
ncbi:hypothetical protein ACFS5N_11070 [Mucilaginibacter ximonensis]|uniref:Antitoxin ParD1/3/4 n=1 Tax=Mucilaginibacter ximonensis TaxID=538021 RepID=A0ABW5YCE1_9SPHI